MRSCCKYFFISNLASFFSVTFSSRRYLTKLRKLPHASLVPDFDFLNVFSIFPIKSSILKENN